MIRKNINTGEEIHIDKQGKAWIWCDNEYDPGWEELPNFCITNEWKKVI